MPESKKKVTRIMKVTMDEDEFEKYDKGITHSDSGLRNEQGRLSALPDIAPVSDDDLPQREIINAGSVYVESEQSEKDSLGAMFVKAAVDIAVDVLNDPEIQQGLAELGKAFWYHKVQPRIKSAVAWIKSDKKFETKASQLIEQQKADAELVYELEVKDAERRKYVVSGEEAARLVEMVREESMRLSAMIYLLSNIAIKDEKTQEEYLIEQAYIKQLLSEESRCTMKMLVENEQLLDESTVKCFSDFLSGYIQKGDQRLPIPLINSTEL